jgi:hypothetical protein
MKIPQFLLMASDQHLAPGTGSQEAFMGRQATALNMVLRIVMTKKMATLIRMKRFVQTAFGPSSFIRSREIDVLAKARVKKVKDCRMKIHFRKGT